MGETDEDGNEPARGVRPRELRLARRHLARDNRPRPLSDEMENRFLQGAMAAHCADAATGSTTFAASQPTVPSANITRTHVSRISTMVTSVPEGRG